MLNGDPFDFLGEPVRPQPSAPSASMPNVAVIKLYLEEVIDRAVRAAAAAGIDLSTVKLVASSYPGEAGCGLAAASAHARLDDKKAGTKLIEKASAWSAEPGRNVYIGLNLMDKAVPATGRGGQKNVVAVVGLVADLDSDKGREWDPASFPIPPTLTVITSRVPALNRQPHWWFARAVDAARARRLAAALRKLVGDEDGATGDIARIWRIPGALNWPNGAKLKRGRPMEPQLVELEHGVIGKPVDPDAFEAALAQALGLPDLDTFGAPAEAAKASPAAAAGAQDSTREAAHGAAGAPPQKEAPRRVYSAADRDRWDGSRNEMLRVATALTFVDADPRETWLKVGNALWYHAPNEPWTRALWDAWSGGGNFEGLRYGGSPKFIAADQQTTWDSFSEYERQRDGRRARPARIGTIYHLAQVQGGKAFNAATARFGRRQVSDAPAVTADVQAVLDAGAATPKGALHSASLRALVRHFALCADLHGQPLQMLLVIESFINTADGVAWPGMHTISYRMSQQRAAVPFERIRRILRELVDAGYLIMSDGRGATPYGKRRSIYALKPPGTMTWDDLLAWENEQTKHRDPVEPIRKWKTPTGTDDAPDHCRNTPPVDPVQQWSGGGGGDIPPPSQPTSAEVGAAVVEGVTSVEPGSAEPGATTSRVSERRGRGERGATGTVPSGDPGSDVDATEVGGDASRVGSSKPVHAKAARRAQVLAARVEAVLSLTRMTSRLPVELIAYVGENASALAHPSSSAVEQLQAAIDEAHGLGCDDARIRWTLERAFFGASSAYQGEAPDGTQQWDVKDLSSGAVKAGDFVRQVRNRFALALLEDPVAPVELRRTDARKLRHQRDTRARRSRHRRETARPTPPHRPAQAPPAHQPAPYQHQQPDPNNAYRRARDGE